MTSAEMALLRPITIRNNETGDVYTLGFTRESVIEAERHGFLINKIDCVTRLYDLFYWALRSTPTQRAITQEQSMKICDELFGSPVNIDTAILERIIALYNACITVSDEEAELKKSRITVQM